MTAISEQLLEQARGFLPRLRAAKLEITPIEKGGSDRRFFRVRADGAAALILVKYNSERAENRHYAEFAEFLTDHGIRAPKVLFHDATEGLIGLEDLGERDLWSYRADEWVVRRSLYRSALTEVRKLHAAPADKMREKLQPAFDSALYQWEQDYFFEHCLGGYFQVEAKSRAEAQALPRLREITEELASLPRVLIHRDFNSQNIMVRDEQTYLIDFQGMRFGLAEYDLASLLFDPYVNLIEAERAELLTDFEIGTSETFRLCAMQRLMQALGAYGFLGLVKGNAMFLQHIPAALKSLRTVVVTIPGLEKLSRALPG